SHGEGDTLSFQVLRGKQDSQQACTGSFTIGKGTKSEVSCQPVGGQSYATATTGDGGQGGGSDYCTDQAGFAVLACHDFRDNQAGDWPTSSDSQSIETVVSGNYLIHIIS